MCCITLGLDTFLSCLFFLRIYSFFFFWKTGVMIDGSMNKIGVESSNSSWWYFCSISIDKEKKSNDFKCSMSYLHITWQKYLFSHLLSIVYLQTMNTHTHTHTHIYISTYRLYIYKEEVDKQRFGLCGIPFFWKSISQLQNNQGIWFARVNAEAIS